MKKVICILFVIILSFSISIGLSSCKKEDNPGSKTQNKVQDEEENDFNSTQNGLKNGGIYQGH